MKQKSGDPASDFKNCAREYYAYLMIPTSHCGDAARSYTYRRFAAWAYRMRDVCFYRATLAASAVHRTPFWEGKLPLKRSQNVNVKIFISDWTGSKNEEVQLYNYKIYFIFLRHRTCSGSYTCGVLPSTPNTALPAKCLTCLRVVRMLKDRWYRFMTSDHWCFSWLMPRKHI